MLDGKASNVRRCSSSSIRLRTASGESCAYFAWKTAKLANASSCFSCFQIPLSYLLALAARDRIEHIALFMNETALPWRGRKQGGNGCQQPLMPIRHARDPLGSLHACAYPARYSAIPLCFLL